MIKSYKDKKPKISPKAFVAETAVIIGDVEVGEKSNIWYGVTIRADINHIRIGAETNIQENTVIHVDLNDRGLGDCATTVGDRVTVGHGAILHGCKIEDDCLIGMGAIVLSGARIGAGSVVAAGALVKEGRQIPPRSMVMGMPAEVKRQLPEEAVEKIRASAKHYVELAEEHKR
ncbi:gamma carbonic anhydrase family protein [candidate division TA06 bacterium]|uniref:Gamma carbonic anhydrase family protein n=1 Tax=candidate division TA06 bacterium TaxID=2250710 RepID=A0A933I9H5_UNCT6|nr:gamma carbonic anhydrase family protein [candidate division TA06 bacterium]